LFADALADLPIKVNLFEEQTPKEEPKTSPKEKKEDSIFEEEKVEKTETKKKPALFGDDSTDMFSTFEEPKLSTPVKKTTPVAPRQASLFEDPLADPLANPEADDRFSAFFS
jgi:hypothetical protein